MSTSKTAIAIRINRIFVVDFMSPTSFVELEINGGDEGIRTPDLGVANAALSHLSYIPTIWLAGWLGDFV